MSDLVIPLHTLDAQRRAADPRSSAWVSANAGAGKTKVLTDRVLRLLFKGAQPGRILCLTFTKAAAANMAIKVFERLGRWVTQDDIQLADELRELEGRPVGRKDIRRARRLFARTIETPGGLKIETLHAFCERILHLVPFEANVPARFSVLDENLANELTERTIAETLAGIVGGTEPDLLEAWGIVGAEASGDILRAALGAALSNRTLPIADGMGAVRDKLAAALGIDADTTPQAIRLEMLDGGLAPDRLREIVATLAASTKTTDRDRAEDIGIALATTTGANRFERYFAVFFTQAGTPRADRSIVTQSVPAEVKQELIDERDRLAGLHDTLKAAEACQRTLALFTLVARIRQRIEVYKTRTGALDFDDLIHKTLDVLSRSDAAWVLYKLDRGIDHVLVDEAQDTNPEQWQILRMITEDFTSGVGIRETGDRTLFAVGDPKQSIYGFQGAAPHEFEHSRRHWQGHVADAGQRFEDVRLTLSFRSVRAVLSAVDATFAVPENFKGLSFEAAVTETLHVSARPPAPGEVELWPLERPREEEEPDAWVTPLDLPEASSPAVIVARRIAHAVSLWLSKGDESGRMWRAGDVLILVRKRGTAFEAVIRALKEKGVPVAGQDRIDIGSHIAVLDLIAAGRAALLPQDDLTLATALKSPLGGLDDDDLFALAANREEGEALVCAIERHAAAGHETARNALNTLAAWQTIARDFWPFGFFATLLGPLQGRAKLVSRLGTEAGDAIDAFLSFARNAEIAETPSLLTFLARFDDASHSIKRDFESARDEVRVMTVHGAKGLEAPVTILIDGCDVLGRDPVLVPVPIKGETVLVWTTKKADCPVTGQARDMLREKALEEHHRLLYVAMTRAKDKLVVAPFMTSARGEPSPEAWSEMIRAGLGARPERLTPRENFFGSVDVWHEGDGQARSAVAPKAPLPPKTPLPDWLREPVAQEPEPLPPLRPSTALGAAEAPARPSDGPYARKARLRGTLAHALIEQLPEIAPDKREAIATAYLSAQAPAWTDAERLGLTRDITGLLDNPLLAPLFGPGSRAEIPVAGMVATASGPVPVSGQIDRFVVLDHEILIADFKTTAHPPETGDATPLSHAAQLALYAELLGGLYPGHRIRPFVIWTSGPVIRELIDLDCAAALTCIKNSRQKHF